MWKKIWSAILFCFFPPLLCWRCSSTVQHWWWIKVYSIRTRWQVIVVVFFLSSRKEPLHERVRRYQTGTYNRSEFLTFPVLSRSSKQKCFDESSRCDRVAMRTRTWFLRTKRRKALPSCVELNRWMPFPPVSSQNHQGLVVNSAPGSRNPLLQHEIFRFEL